ncbi:hypothetical protein IAU60_000295 [Kwoniella sp. DSM 27419]
MPGSKRRALKKLLSPHSDPQDASPSSSPIPVPHADSSASLSTQISTLQGDDGSASASGSGLPPAVVDPTSALSQAEVEEDLVLEQMAEREKEIGHASSPGGLGVASPSSGAGASSLATTSVPAHVQAPMNGGMGGGMYGNGLGNGAGSGGKKKKSSRQKFEERQARKQEALVNSAPPADPNWTAQLEKERQEEIQAIGNACSVLGREIYEIAPDGHCMFSAIADQLGQIGAISPKDAGNYHITRQAAAQFMLSHPDDFMPFLPSITGEDSAGATDDGMMTEAGFKKYCKIVAETGEWGGEPEIQALSRAYNVPIHVFQRGPPTVVSHGGASDQFGGAMTPEQSMQSGDKVVRISYHKRMYGLGEHYNSLRVAQE